MKEQKYVLFNDGENENVHALVVGGTGSTLDLYVIPTSGESYIANGIARREKRDYGAEGGGRTWHL